MLKRIVSLLLVVALLFMLCSCKKDTSSTTTDSALTDSLTVKATLNSTSSIDEGLEYDPQNKNVSDWSGQHDKFGNFTPPNIRANGIDVSKWQGKIDWSRVAKAGVEFAIIRIGYRGENGKIYKDENADYNIQQAEKEGILVGAYFQSSAISVAEAKEEATFTVSQIKGYSISYPVAFVYKEFSKKDSRMYELSKEQRTDNAIAFLSEVKAVGYEPMFYANTRYGETEQINVEIIEKSYKVWVGKHDRIISDPERLVYNGRCNMWQYTNRGTVDGIETGVYLNVSYFKPKKANPKEPNAAPSTAEPPKSFDELQYTKVNEQVTAKDTVYLRKGPSTSFDNVGTLKNGEVLTRIAIGKNGWSKLQREDKIVYALSSWLTTNLSYKTPNTDILEGNTFTPTTGDVTAKDTVNLRERPTIDSPIVGVLKYGDYLWRTAVSDNGWSRLRYSQNKEVYAITDFLSTDRLQAQSTPTSEMMFTRTEGQVTAKTEANLRDGYTVRGSNVVYILKKGEFLKRTGISDEGWSRLEYNGQTVYAVTSYLEEK